MTSDTRTADGGGVGQSLQSTDERITIKDGLLKNKPVVKTNLSTVGS